MNLNSYYLAISGLQKAVRRGLEEQAVKLARIAWELKSDYLYGRLHTILFEECGRDRSVLKWRYDNHIQKKNWFELETFVRVMAASEKKSNESVALMFWIHRQFEFPESIHSAQLNKIRGGWPEKKFEVYDEIELNITLDWIIEVCERLFKLDREGLSCGIPYLNQEFEDCDVVDDCDEGECWNGLIPYSAFDKHNRIGKHCLNTYYKDVKECQVIPRNLFHSAVFRYEGMLIRRRLTHPIPFRFISPEDFNNESCAEVSTAISDGNLNVCRRWVFEKNYPDEVAYFKKF